MTTMTNEKWNVRIGDRSEAISADLLLMLGFSQPYSDDEARWARDESHGRYGLQLMAETWAAGFSGDEAAMEAVRRSKERRAAQSLETARQKVAELEAKAAADRRAAAGLDYARAKEARSR